MNHLVVQEAQTLEYIVKRSLPLLYKVFGAINPTNAVPWIVPFAKAGITDASFPTSLQAMTQTCQTFGICLSAVELEHFNRLQYIYFAGVVVNGEHIIYDDDKPTPYKVIKTPGFPKSGTFGQVEKVMFCADPSTTYARKRLLVITEYSKPMIEKEVALLRRFKHPHSIQFHGSYSHQGGFFLIFDLADGNLAEFFKSPPMDFINLSESAKGSKLVNWMIDIADALTEFHAVGGIHRDLKPENVLIKHGTILLSDFGLATQSGRISSHIASIHGTEKYMAPEQGRGLKYGRSADVFAMGCIFLEIITFARNISLDYFDHFRREWGSRQCPNSRNLCYRHNLQAVSLFIAQFLRGKSATGEPLLDLIESSLIPSVPVLRIASEDVKQRLLIISDTFAFFKKADCCSGLKIRLQRRDVSMKSLEGRFGRLEIGDLMDIDMGGSKGPLKVPVF